MYYRLSKHYLSWPCTTLLGRPDATKFIKLTYHTTTQNPEKRVPSTVCYSRLASNSIWEFLDYLGSSSIGGIFILFALIDVGQCAKFQTMFHIYASDLLVNNPNFGPKTQCENDTDG